MCFIMQITQGTAPDMNPPDYPADFCDFCQKPYEFCHCDDHGFLLTGFGRAALYDTPDLRPAVRSAYATAACNGSSSVCNVLAGLMPELEEEEACSDCGELNSGCLCPDYSPAYTCFGIHEAI